MEGGDDGRVADIDKMTVTLEPDRITKGGLHVPGKDRMEFRPPERKSLLGLDVLAIAKRGSKGDGVFKVPQERNLSSLTSLDEDEMSASSGVDDIRTNTSQSRRSYSSRHYGEASSNSKETLYSGWFLGAYFLGGYEDDGKGVNGLTKAVFAAVKSWAVGISLGVTIRAATSSHIPPASFVLVTMGSTGILLIGWRALISSLLPYDQRKKNDVYRRESPFELFERRQLGISHCRMAKKPFGLRIKSFLLKISLPSYLFSKPLPMLSYNVACVSVIN